ncbi:DUF1549 domain-containing protein [Planctomicrobium sp. SH527]|uniref:DUF1549 domain-containing protein n=1 Tax=Planctomicrobium sp. SH527 TaxID=3448123 RepID=UPI003F5AFAD7
MGFRTAACLLGVFACVRFVSAGDLPPAVDRVVDYEKDIAPILAAKCLDCHGEETQESRFRLDRKSALLRGGDSGEPAIVLGKSEQSHLIRLVAGLEPGQVMPPSGSESLTKSEIAILRAWIDQGVTWPGPAGELGNSTEKSDHWSLQPLATVAPPAMSDAWGQTPVDAFILKVLQERRLTPNAPADRRTFIRRLFLDTLGLPPSPEDVQRYVDDASTDATSELIERVLASPHYGERQARYWLDLVRFAETNGFETNSERPNAWGYRDFVIQSFNDDLPYHEFIKAQISGDSIGQPVGLGFLVAGPWDQVKSPDINLTMMQRQNELDDMINTTGTVFLGLTLGCARCHNHKFDPISQTDYYALQAIFAGVQHGDMTLPLSPKQEEEQISQLFLEH